MEDTNADVRSSRPSLDLYHVMRQTCGEEMVTRWVCEYNPYAHGLEVLSKYIAAARGPLKGTGWEYSRAVELMVTFKRAAAATTVTIKGGEKAAARDRVKGAESAGVNARKERTKKAAGKERTKKRGVASSKDRTKEGKGK